jgi:protein gp37
MVAASMIVGGVRKHETGRTLNGRTFDEMPRVLEAVG